MNRKYTFVILSFLAFMMTSGIHLLEGRANRTCKTCIVKRHKKHKNPVKAVVDAAGKACKSCATGVKKVGEKVIKEPLKKLASKKSKHHQHEDTDDDNKVVKVSCKEEFEALKESGIPMLVEVYTPWCGPCKTMAPKLKHLASKYSNVIIAKINADKMQFVRSEYSINGFPTFLFFKNGVQVNQLLGSFEIQTLEKEIAKLLA